MSTFGGVMSEFEDIRVDFFRQIPGKRPPLACFLSHVHSDHLAGLENFKSPFIYASPATKEILLRLERYPHRLNFATGILESRKQTYKHLKKLIKTIPLETPTKVELAPGNVIQVTLFDANHCTGAVMFLFEGNGNAVLYTGDIRSEPWFVNNLTRNPLLIEYTHGLKTLNCIYLDTSNTQSIKFTTKADGLRELIAKVKDYPDDTVFHLSAWTFGYEEVWLALSRALNSPVHVDAYKLRLYRSIRDWKTENPPPFAPEGPALVGYKCGNAYKHGCLTDDSKVRIHSCEKGMRCSEVNEKTIWIRPIVTRIAGGAMIEEMGVGGGGGDLQQRPELEVDSDIVVAEILKAAENLDGSVMLEGIEEQLRSSLGSGRQIIQLDELVSDKALDFNSPIPLPDFVQALIRTAVSKARNSAATPDNPSINYKLPTTITFPYSRHSSYEELCNLVRAFKPKDVYPCTVHEEYWYQNIITIGSLFGKECSGKIFRHDAEMTEFAQARGSQNQFSQQTQTTVSSPESSPLKSQGNRSSTMLSDKNGFSIMVKRTVAVDPTSSKAASTPMDKTVAFTTGSENDFPSISQPVLGDKNGFSIIITRTVSVAPTSGDGNNVASVLKENTKMSTTRSKNDGTSVQERTLASTLDGGNDLAAVSRDTTMASASGVGVNITSVSEETTTASTSRGGTGVTSFLKETTMASASGGGSDVTSVFDQTTMTTSSVMAPPLPSRKGQLRRDSRGRLRLFDQNGDIIPLLPKDSAGTGFDELPNEGRTRTPCEESEITLKSTPPRPLIADSPGSESQGLRRKLLHDELEKISSDPKRVKVTYTGPASSSPATTQSQSQGHGDSQRRNPVWADTSRLFSDVPSVQRKSDNLDGSTLLGERSSRSVLTPSKKAKKTAAARSSIDEATPMRINIDRLVGSPSQERNSSLIPKNTAQVDGQEEIEDMDTRDSVSTSASPLNRRTFIPPLNRLVAPPPRRQPATVDFLFQSRSRPPTSRFETTEPMDATTVVSDVQNLTGEKLDVDSPHEEDDDDEDGDKDGDEDGEVEVDEDEEEDEDTNSEVQWDEYQHHISNGPARDENNKYIGTYFDEEDNVTRFEMWSANGYCTGFVHENCPQDDPYLEVRVNGENKKNEEANPLRIALNEYGGEVVDESMATLVAGDYLDNDIEAYDSQDSDQDLLEEYDLDDPFIDTTPLENEPIDTATRETSRHGSDSDDDDMSSESDGETDYKNLYKELQLEKIIRGRDFQMLRDAHAQLAVDYGDLADNFQQMKEELGIADDEDMDELVDANEIDEDGAIIVEPPAGGRLEVAEVTISSSNSEASVRGNNGEGSAEPLISFADSGGEEIIRQAAANFDASSAEDEDGNNERKTAAALAAQLASTSPEAEILRQAAEQRQKSVLDEDRVRDRIRGFEAAAQGGSEWHDVSLISTGGGHGEEEIEL